MASKICQFIVNMDSRLWSYSWHAGITEDILTQRNPTYTLPSSHARSGSGASEPVSAREKGRTGERYDEEEEGEEESLVC